MKKPPGPIAKRGKRTELEAWIDRAQPSRIGEAEFQEICAALAPISESYLRKLLRQCGVPLAVLVEGVRQSNLDELESSLMTLLEEYEAGDPGRQRAIRRIVITAKDHARWAGKKKQEKEEMVLWMTTWLENPPVFPSWVKLRRSRPN